MTKLIYIADPMCSWCYGFGPELTTLLSGLPELPVDVVVGGLRAYSTEVMDAAKKASIISHWKQVGERTGLPFDDAAIAQDGFIYNTEPACRAVVVARGIAPEATLSVFNAIQHAFYAEGQDITRQDVLARVCSAALNKAGVSIDEEAFAMKWASEDAITTTHADFVQTQRWLVQGFPTVVLQRDDQLHLVTSGYVGVEQLVEQMQALVDQTAN